MIPDAELLIVAYDRAAVYALLRDCTARRLGEALRAGRQGQGLSPTQRRALEQLLAAWAQRALGELPLRDALLVDTQRGPQLFSLLCAAHTVAAVAVPEALRTGLAPASALSALPAVVADSRGGAALVRAEAAGLALAVIDRSEQFPFPDDLDELRPSLPTPHTPLRHRFEQPTGWRRRIAVLLAAGGVLALGAPLLVGQIPEYPARLPLALLTLALLVGIRAGWAGFVGSLCIWLVANLPGFRHGTGLAALWPALPLLAIGLLLLRRDRHVRAMWGWLKARLRG
jgi:hypothetical protein